MGVTGKQNKTNLTRLYSNKNRLEISDLERRGLCYLCSKNKAWTFLEGKYEWIIGGAKGYVGPPFSIIGGGLAPPAPPPLPTPMAIYHKSKQRLVTQLGSLNEMSSQFTTFMNGHLFFTPSANHPIIILCTHCLPLSICLFCIC